MNSLKLSFLSALLTTTALSAAETNVVDAIGLGYVDDGTGFTNGWYVCNMDHYAKDRHYALRFSTTKDEEEYVLSPVFDRPVTRIDLSVCSSASNAVRYLAFTPLRDGIAVSNLTQLCAASPKNYSFNQQTITWPYSARVTSFRIDLTEGKSTGWGIWKMAVIFDDPQRGTSIIVR